jgi:hypothetical protein
MRDEDTIFCDGCGVEITWTPVKVNHKDYCCEDCRDGFECGCSSALEEDDYPRGSGSSQYDGVYL